MNGWIRRGWLVVGCTALLAPASCVGQAAGERPCAVYRPHLAKGTFDGRVGAVLVYNGGGGATEVRVYHPDGVGDVERRWSVAPGRLLPLTGDDGARLALGNDWGIRIGDGCVRTLGDAAAWRAAEFAITWTGDSMRAGIDGAR